MKNSTDIIDLKPKTFSKFYEYTMDGDPIPKGSHIDQEWDVVDKNGRMVSQQDHLRKAQLADALKSPF